MKYPVLSTGGCSQPIGFPSFTWGQLRYCYYGSFLEYSLVSDPVWWIGRGCCPMAWGIDRRPERKNAF